MIEIECVAVVEDARTPARLLQALLDRAGPTSRPFLLESASWHPQFGRWSFLGLDPFLVLRARGAQIEIARTGPDGRTTRQYLIRDPLDVLAETIETFRASPAPRSPAPFQAGAVGAVSYDLGRLIEPVVMNAEDDLRLPDLDIAFYGAVVAYDHRTGRAYFTRMNVAAAPEPHWIERAMRLARVLPSMEDDAPTPDDAPTDDVVSNMSREAFLKAVHVAQEYIAAGDIYQVNVAQRFEAHWPGTAWALYERLRRTNPAPFAAYLDMGDVTILSSSPERFLKLDAATRRIETRPIKGTRPLGDSPADEARLARALLASDKDAAELVMIVDLERNDLGRVCEVGTVHVPQLRALETYAAVQHTVATIEGRLRSDCRISDLLRATLPGGSITGAPKIRAMQIIDALEPNRRGFYTGAIGYFDFAGNLDLNIAIRTLILKESRAYLGVGSGIVADSDAASEYEETLDKARALFDALGVGRWFLSSGSTAR